MAGPRRIDVHHHAAPPSYLEARSRDPNWNPAQGAWTVERSLEDMERGNVETAILSLPHAANIWPADVREGRRLAREWNEYMAGLARAHPGRFGVFAILPALDIDGSLAEAAYALDELRADGVLLMTNIGDRWLGDPHYAPLFEELDRRRAIVYTHPAAPACCQGLLPGVHDSVIEFSTDTARAIAQLLFGGMAARFPGIRFIFSHAGGTMPILADRFIHAPLYAKRDVKAHVAEGVVPMLNRFWYDCAQAHHVYGMSAFRLVVSLKQLLFGTDFPYTSAAETAKGMEASGLAAGELRGVWRENAERLMPRYRRAAL